MQKIAAILLCVLLLGVGQAKPEVPIGPGVLAEALEAAGLRVLPKKRLAKDFTLPLLSGETRALSSFKGQVVLLNFWATWCNPCTEEMPSMEELYTRLRAHGLEVLAVNLNEKPKTVADFIQKSGYTFPVLLDQSGKASRKYGIQAIPATFIIDREGYVIAAVVGSKNWTDPAILAALESCLNAGQ
ncbi:MAG: TlpA family protein disulfide reductase [Candidatus Margulisbacteria bacterium]|jgi:peroxiredoxin|nr:TlpA family protein disulfide reductase [Candidatus Margulisiibacteriota bacterium]